MDGNLNNSDKEIDINKKRITNILWTIGIIGVGIVGYFFVRSRTFADFTNPFIRETTFSTLKLDEGAYGSTVFDNSNLDFRPILDKDVLNDKEHVINISFWVGGNKDNNTEKPIYDIALQDLRIDCNLLSPYVKWMLLKNGIELSSGSLDYQFDTISNGRLVLTPIQQDLVSYSDDKSVYDYYQFYLWLSDSCQEDDITLCNGKDSQDEILGKKISGKIEVELLSKTKVALVRNPSSVLDTGSCILSKED